MKGFVLLGFLHPYQVAGMGEPWHIKMTRTQKLLAALGIGSILTLTEDDLYWKAYLSSLQIAAFSTALALLVGFPIAYGMAKAPEEWRPTLMMLVILGSLVTFAPLYLLFRFLDLWTLLWGVLFIVLAVGTVYARLR